MLLTVIASADEDAILGIWGIIAIVMFLVWLIILWQMKNVGMRILEKEQ